MRDEEEEYEEEEGESTEDEASGQGRRIFNTTYYQDETKKKFHWILGRYSLLHGASAAARHFHVSRGKAQYWERKFYDPLFHPNAWGGARWEVLPIDIYGQRY